MRDRIKHIIEQMCDRESFYLNVEPRITRAEIEEIENTLDVLLQVENLHGAEEGSPQIVYPLFYDLFVKQVAEHKEPVRVRPVSHNELQFPIARWGEQRHRVWLVGKDSGTVEGFFDVVSIIDVGMNFNYAFASPEEKHNYEDYQWEGLVVFHPEISEFRFAAFPWSGDIVVVLSPKRYFGWVCDELRRFGWDISVSDFLGN